MRWFVVLPGALLPAPIAADVFAAGDFADADALLAQCAEPVDLRYTLEGAPYLAWMWERFGGTGTPVTAPYALAARDAQAARTASQCWHIEPVHFAYARDHLLVNDLRAAPLQAEEQQQLEPALRAAVTSVAASEAALHVAGAQWFLTLDRPWALSASPLEAALGQSARAHWPEGPDALRWRKLLTEVQTEWHQHPINARRESLGQLTVNALWLHGGGRWTELARPFASIASGDGCQSEAAMAWAHASGAVPLPQHDAASHARLQGNALSVWLDLQTPAREQAWGLWLQAAAPLFRRLMQVRDAAFDAGFSEVVLILGGQTHVRSVTLPGGRWNLRRLMGLRHRPTSRQVLTESHDAAPLASMKTRAPS